MIKCVWSKKDLGFEARYTYWISALSPNHPWCVHFDVELPRVDLQLVMQYLEDEKESSVGNPSVLEIIASPHCQCCSELQELNINHGTSVVSKFACRVKVELTRVQAQSIFPNFAWRCGNYVPWIGDNLEFF